MLSHLKPQITRITDPNGVDKQLFASWVSLYEDLFPHQAARPDPTVVADWLEREHYSPDSAAWPELLIVSHVDQQVTGFVQLNYHRTTPFAFGAFLGIAENGATARP